MRTADAEVRELRALMRGWRRARAEVRLVDAFSDAYIAIFAAAMLGAMCVNLVLTARSAIGSGCSTVGCSVARDTLPWVSAVALLTAALVAASLLGPLMVSPADGTWLLPAPISRAALLGPRLTRVTAVAVAAGVVVGALLAGLAGYPVSVVVAFTALLAGLCLAAAGFSAVAQSRWLHATGGIARVLAGLLWVWLVLLATGATAAVGRPTHRTAVGLTVAAVISWLAGAGLFVTARVHLPRMHRDRLMPGGVLLPNLSGALASLDPALVFDILVSRKWRSRATVRPYRGGPRGAWALAWRDLIRLRRSPGSVVILTAAVVVPYVGSTLGLGKVDAPLAALTAFLAGPSLCTSLRALSATEGLLRCLPMPGHIARWACVAVPGLCLVCWGLATVPALHDADLADTWSNTVIVAVAVGVAATASTVRWITAAPPNYALPMVSSPGGAIPPGLFTSAARGFDVLLLTTASLLLFSPASGAVVSLLASAVVLAVVLRPRTSVYG
ncbi:MAG: DUF6297 family protein [Nocardioidaceae bacterium]